MFFFLIFKSFTIDGVIWVFNIIQCSRDYKLFLFMVIQGDQSWVDLIPVTGGEFFIQARISTIVGCYSEQFLSASEAVSSPCKVQWKPVGLDSLSGGQLCISKH